MFCSFILNDLLGKELHLNNDLLLHAQKYCSTFSKSCCQKNYTMFCYCMLRCNVRSLNNGLFMSAQTQCSVAAFSEFCCQNTTQSLFRQKSAFNRKTPTCCRSDCQHSDCSRGKSNKNSGKITEGSDV